MSKKVPGDWVIVSKICGISNANAKVIAQRPNSKKYRMVMDALVRVIENRERLLKTK